MSLLVKETQKELREKILDALGRAIANGELPAEPLPAFNIEKPANSANGDFSSNIALAGAKAFKKAPRMKTSIWKIRFLKRLKLQGRDS